jgi:hypothetical protein
MFPPDHRTLVAHAECAGTPRVMREAQTKTPNRERLGAELWWPGALSKKPLQAAPVLGFSYFLKFWVQVRVQPLNRCFLTIFRTRTTDKLVKD